MLSSWDDALPSVSVDVALSRFDLTRSGLWIPLMLPSAVRNMNFIFWLDEPVLTVHDVASCNSVATGEVA